MDYLTIDEAAQRGHSEDFFANVRREVIPRLIAAGRLKGKVENGRQMVAADESFDELTGYGVERFVYNQQGWSFCAVDAPIGDVSRSLGGRPCVVGRQQNVTPRPMTDDASVEPAGDRRQTFLVKTRRSRWTVLVQTVHWFHQCDAVMGVALASVLSKAINCRALAAWDDDFSGSSLVVCQNGDRTESVSDEEDWAAFYHFFYEAGIYVPESFISGGDGTAQLLSRAPSEVERADHFVLKVPQGLSSGAPHVFEKLGMMAEAIAEDLDDEEAFMAHMKDGVWAPATAAIAAGQV